jgi:hypothetical protein
MHNMETALLLATTPFLSFILLFLLFSPWLSSFAPPLELVLYHTFSPARTALCST